MADQAVPLLHVTAAMEFLTAGAVEEEEEEDMTALATWGVLEEVGILLEAATLANNCLLLGMAPHLHKSDALFSLLPVTQEPPPGATGRDMRSQANDTEQLIKVYTVQLHVVCFTNYFNQLF